MQTQEYDVETINRLYAVNAELLGALEDIEEIATGQFPDELFGPCHPTDSLCPQCQEFGCIRNKIDRARAAIAKAKP